MYPNAYTHLIENLNLAAEPFVKEKPSYSQLLQSIGNARFVLIGEATHGTHEFYQIRAEITKQLILQHGFMAVAIEGDWPNVYHVNRYLKGRGEKLAWQQSLQSFTRFPTWMWRNRDIGPFLLWLRDYNDRMANPELKIGLFGLDLYSLYTSIAEVIHYLSLVDQKAAQRARERYACFDQVQKDPQTYGYLTNIGVKNSCVQAVVDQLLELQHQAMHYLKDADLSTQDEYFYAVQNAQLVKDAERYYRAMFTDHISSWNIRDTHMADTVDSLANYLEDYFKKPAKIVIWAHNSHVGDARATEMSGRGEINIGQLLKERYAQDTYAIGFSTYQGRVTAASNWDEPAQLMHVKPGLPGSYEELFHQLEFKNFILNLRQEYLQYYLKVPRLQRAIGVVYRPDTERESHYFFTHLPYQFDSIIHIDETNAVIPLEFKPERIAEELSEPS